MPNETQPRPTVNELSNTLLELRKDRDAELADLQSQYEDGRQPLVEAQRQANTAVSDFDNAYRALVDGAQARYRAALEAAGVDIDIVDPRW